MTTAMTEPTDTITPDEIATYLATLTPAERAAHKADAELLEAEEALDAATAELEAARRVATETSTSATRSRVARAQRASAAAQEREILASENYRRAAAAAGIAAEDQAESELAALRTKIRATVQSAATAVGLFATLSTLSSQTGLPQVGATTLAALADLATAARVLTARLDSEGWPKPSNNREVPR